MAALVRVRAAAAQGTPADTVSATPATSAVAGCSTVVSRAGLAPAVSGARIREVRIVTHAPPPFRGPARFVNRLHTRTLPSTVRRELLFAVGDTVDPLRVAESLRRLRNLGFLQEAWLTATRCAAPVRGERDEVELVVETRDAWSTLPEANSTPTQQRLGLHEINLLGTGRTLSGVLRWDATRLGDSYRFGGELGISDPALTPRISAGASVVAFVDGRAWGVAAGSRPRTLADRWIARGAVSQLVLAPSGVGAEQVRRDRGAVLVGRRVSAEGATPSAVYLLGGAEAERTRVTGAARSARLGPAAVRRSFVGPDAGLARRAVRFDTLTWLLPSGGIADVPLGVEGEMVVGVGRDLVARAGALRADGWVGRVWRPGRTGLVATDAWASGYVLGDSAGGDEGTAPRRRLSAASLRGSVTGFRATGDGLWSLRVGVERRLRPDPDVRPVVGLDPTAAFVWTDVRLAGVAATASLERSTHLWAISRSAVLDGALFTAASRRWHPASAVAGDPLTLGVVGAALRLAPTRPWQPTAGVELLYPVLRPELVRRRPLVRVAFVPWFGALRGR